MFYWLYHVKWKYLMELFIAPSYSCYTTTTVPFISSPHSMIFCHILLPWVLLFVLVPTYTVFTRKSRLIVSLYFVDFLCGVYLRAAFFFWPVHIKKSLIFWKQTLKTNWSQGHKSQITPISYRVNNKTFNNTNLRHLSQFCPIILGIATHDASNHYL